MEKVLVEVYYTYGKGDGEEIGDSFVAEDSKGLRKDLVEEYGRSSLFINGNKESFIAGEESAISFENDGGDWDDPTGFSVVILTYSEKKARIEKQYQRSLRDLNKQFGIEDKYA